jgi:hypothetical protein
MDRFTSMGISNDAQEFLEAARIVRAQKPVTFAPMYFLACQSIELSTSNQALRPTPPVTLFLPPFP